MIADTLPTESEMQRIAAEVGFSETAFAASTGTGWRVRYFSPESEVPFCGHATIALGAALALRYGDGVFALALNHADITVEGRRNGSVIAAALQSPPTRSLPAPVLLASAVLALKTREALASIKYDLNAGRSLMKREGVVTIILAHAETAQLFHTRNPFAFGGVYEDPATGAATAAFAGYLRDTAWPHAGAIDVVQGEDMGMRSRLRAKIPPPPGSSIRVSGTARIMQS